MILFFKYLVIKVIVNLIKELCPYIVFVYFLCVLDFFAFILQTHYLSFSTLVHASEA